MDHPRCPDCGAIYTRRYVRRSDNTLRLVCDSCGTVHMSDYEDMNWEELDWNIAELEYIISNPVWSFSNSPKFSADAIRWAETQLPLVLDLRDISFQREAIQ